MKRELIYTTLEGDRFDLIAWKIYGDVRLQDVLIAANPGLAIVPVLAGGLNIRIPDLGPLDQKPPGLPPWKRR